MIDPNGGLWMETSGPTIRIDTSGQGYPFRGCKTSGGHTVSPQKGHPWPFVQTVKPFHRFLVGPKKLVRSSAFQRAFPFLAFLVVKRVVVFLLS